MDKIERLHFTLFAAKTIVLILPLFLLELGDVSLLENYTVNIYFEALFLLLVSWIVSLAAHTKSFLTFIFPVESLVRVGEIVLGCV